MLTSKSIQYAHVAAAEEAIQVDFNSYQNSADSQVDGDNERRHTTGGGGEALGKKR